MTDKEWEKKWGKAMAQLRKAHMGWYAAQRDEKKAWATVHALVVKLPASMTSERTDRDIAKALGTKGNDHG
jgi:hypothetical protein